MHSSMLLSFSIKQGFILFMLSFFTSSLWGQELDDTYKNSPIQNVFLFSNLDEIKSDAPIFQQLKSIVERAEGEKSLLFIGDYLDKNGMGTSPNKREKEKVESLLKLTNVANQTIFVPGDKDWDNGGENGLKKVEAFQRYINKNTTSNVYIAPENGCLGPEVIDIGDNLRIVAINTQWWVHRHKRPVEEDLKCPNYNEIEFWDDLGDAIQDSDNRNVIIAAHHPILSYGQYAGHALSKTHFLPPVLGSFMAAYHLSVGAKKDLSQEKFEGFSKNLLSKLERYTPVIYASGHEYDLQINRLDGSYHMNSGSMQEARPTAKGKYSQFHASKRGFTQLVFLKNGQVKAHIWTLETDGTFKITHEQVLYKSSCADNELQNSHLPFNQQFNPCIKINGKMLSDAPTTDNRVASNKFKAGKLKRFFMGTHYREAWGAEIKDVPYLNLDTLHGGLIPTSKGGGGQTVSLKFEGADRQEFAFRLLEKQPNKKIDKELKNTVFVNLMEDVTATQHPYAALVASHFMEVLGLPHSHPKIYLMPDHPRLGPYREEFADTYGLWEIKPKEKKKDRKGFQDADEVDSTFKMYENLMEDHESTFDTETYVLARLFDMWVSDWDRHQDNWKWLGYENEEGGLDYTPFPKDRDKVFNLFQGLYQLMDWDMLDSYRARFRESYKSIKNLNNKARNLDRILINEFTYEDWMKVVTMFENLMSDEVIEQALRQFPAEVYDFDAPEIARLLKIRRAKLRAAVTKFYKHLSKEVTVIGTNKREIFEVHRLEDGAVKVQVFAVEKNDKNKKSRYIRTFKPKETKEIRLYGLGKNDEFNISGTAKSSIKVRVIGGKGKDLIIDDSKVKGPKHRTKVYDFSNKDSLRLGSEGRLSQQIRATFFEAEAIHEDNTYLLVPAISYNLDDGLGIGFTFNRTIQKFAKPDFGIKYNIEGQASTKENYSLSFGLEFRETIKKWDLLWNVLAASPYNLHRFFYGLGNENNLGDEDFNDDYYQNEMTVLSGKLGLRRNFWEKSQLVLSTQYEYLGVEKDTDEDFEPSIYEDLNPEGFGETTFWGTDIDLNLDLRDDGTFPTRGAQFKLENYSFFKTRGTSKFGGRLSMEALWYYTMGVKVPVTLGIRAGHISSYGQVPFYYKSYIGQQSNLRGFRRNRYGGDAATFINTDLRLHLGTVWTKVLPLRFGLYALFDTGRVYVEEESSDKWHYSVGGGAYLIPYVNSFNLNFYLARPDEGQALFNFKIGFFVR